MHERSLVIALLAQVDTLRKHHDGASVLAVRVRVGKFSGVEPELFRFAFEEMSQDTFAREARLELEVVGVQARCDACGGAFDADSFRFVCPACGSGETTVTGGEELTLDGITIEERVR
jgi:hydrogenase nickel incorporation protein HypA/HybF